MAVTDALCRSFLDLWWHFDPSAATAGRLGDFDADSVRQHIAALRSVAGALEELPVEDVADEIDRTALLDHVRVLLFRLEHEHPYQRNPLLWAEHLATAFGAALVPSDPAAEPGTQVAAAAALERLRALPRFVRSAQDSLRRPPQILADAALEQLANVSTLVEQAIERYRPSWTGATGEANAGTQRVVAEGRRALTGLVRALRDQIAPDPDPHGGAIGEAEVDRRLHYEHASIHNAGEVWRAALRHATEAEQEVSALAGAVDPSRPWREVFVRVREGMPDPADLVARFQQALAASRSFTERQGIANAPAPLAVEPLSESDRVLEGFADYRPAGRQPAAVLIGALAPAAIPWIAVRLGEPGLHLHESRADTLPGLVRRHIAASSTPAGWALCAADLMIELGFEPNPESRLLEAVLRLRDAHLAVVDLGLHTRQLTADEAVAHLAERIPSDRRTALADVRRLLSRPLSACAAMLGRQEIHRLRDDCRAARGSGFTWSGFLEDLFSYGGLPVPLIRWGMGIDA
ncbi:MAG: DUF885 family protein [Gemmatimonadales bacterium]